MQKELNIHEQLVQLLLEVLEVDVESMKVDEIEVERIIEEYEIDSLIMVQFFVSVEECFNIQIDDDFLLTEKDNLIEVLEKYISDKIQ